jgi:hypothetical protein
VWDLQVSPRDATGALGAVEARALGGPDGVLAQLGVANSAGEHCLQQLPRDSVGKQLVMRENRRRLKRNVVHRGGSFH